MVVGASPVVAAARCSSRRMRSACSWNRDLCDGNPTSDRDRGRYESRKGEPSGTQQHYGEVCRVPKRPLGTDEPRRVPCPPASSSTPTWPRAMCARPRSRMADEISASCVTASMHSSGRKSSTAPCVPAASWRSRSWMAATSARSILRHCASRCSRSSLESESQKPNTWPCWASIHRCRKLSADSSAILYRVCGERVAVCGERVRLWQRGHRAASESGAAGEATRTRGRGDRKSTRLNSSHT